MWANWGHCILNIWQKFNPFLQPLPCPLVRNSMTNTSKFTVIKLGFNNSQSFTSYSTLPWWSSWKAFGWREQSSRRICMLHFINSPRQRKSRLQVVLLLLSPSYGMRKKTVTEGKNGRAISWVQEEGYYFLTVYFAVSLDGVNERGTTCSLWEEWKFLQTIRRRNQ